MLVAKLRGPSSRGPRIPSREQGPVNWHRSKNEALTDQHRDISQISATRAGRLLGYIQGLAAVTPA